MNGEAVGEEVREEGREGGELSWPGASPSNLVVVGFPHTVAGAKGGVGSEGSTEARDRARQAIALRQPVPGGAEALMEDGFLATGAAGLCGEEPRHASPDCDSHGPLVRVGLASLPSRTLLFGSGRVEPRRALCTRGPTGRAGSRWLQRSVSV